MTYEDSVKARILFTLAFELEKISDEIERMGRTNIEYKIEKTKQIKEITKLSKEIFEKTFDNLYIKKNTNTDEIIKLRNIKVYF